MFRGYCFRTGVMAALAGGYAFYIVFPKEPAISTEALTATEQAVDYLTVILSMIFGCIWV